MKVVKFSLVITATALLTIGLSAMAYAFHSGAVAECTGCHSMHSAPPGGSFLLIKAEPSSTCLDCHAHADTAPSSYHIMTYPVPGSGIPPVERTPGGDFAWLLKSYTFTVRGTVNNEEGMEHGHNVVASDFGILADTENTTSPGGSYPASQLSCVSCHDPHGKYRRIADGSIVTAGYTVLGSGSYNTSVGNNGTPIPDGQAVGTYRLLAGIGHGNPDIGFPGVPVAVAPSTYNQSEATNQVRVAYGYSADASGRTSWGRWCAACHAKMHTDNRTNVHPIDETLGSDVAGIYNKYVNSGNQIGGTDTKAYLSLVPFFENTTDFTVTGYSTLASHASNKDDYLNGPATGDRVSCLSCHRAHASGFPEMLRWSMEGEFITYADANGNAIWPGIDNGAPVQFARGRTSVETKAAYYDRDVNIFGPYQRVLCNKCHAQD
jgi:predicted CXXCH cytochrome family protein